PIRGTNALPPKPDADGISCPQFLLRACLKRAFSKENHKLPADRMRSGPLHGKQRWAVACLGTDKERESWKIQPSCCDV
ncbi:hypothetical protein, partial [Pectobacterium odoriferum]|uniref:hypothetical protein n=1 Tax=Pectobacterium odoriferum TaxID=78398 RepID=UPI001CA4993A